MVLGRVQRKLGTLSVACTTERPSASVSTQPKSWLSRTTVEKEDRSSAAAASSTTETSRVQSSSSRTGSNISRAGCWRR